MGFITTTSRSDFSDKDRELFGIELTPEEIAADKRKTLDDRWAMSAYLPNLMLLRNTGQLLADDVRRAAIAGDGDTAYDDVVAMLGVSRHAAETPFLVSIIVGELVQRQAIAAVRDVLATHSAVWSDDQLRNLAHKFAASRIKWQRGFEGETVAFNDSMQRLYTDDGNGDGRLAYRLPNGMNVFQMIESVVGTITETNPKNSPLANPALAILAMPATNLVVASRKDMTETYEALTDHVRAQIETPLWQQQKNSSLDSELRALKDNPISRVRYLFLDMLMPAYDNLRNRIVVSDGGRDGVFLGLALELYHRQHKKWPASLEELSPQFLPQVPVDRISGKPLHFNVVNDRPLVYSEGPDGDDDNGHAVEGEVVPVPIQSEKAADGDWVIWSGASNG